MKLTLNRREFFIKVVKLTELNKCKSWQMHKVTYKDSGVTKEERMELHRITHQLMNEILTLKRRDLGGELKCERCGDKNSQKWEIHHRKYAPDTNYYDLELLCRKFHRGA